VAKKNLAIVRAKIFRVLAVIGREKVVYGMFLADSTVDYCVILQNTVIFATVQITITSIKNTGGRF
jgi:hypothetical protein